MAIFTILGNYALGRMLGQGAFGEVRLGIHKPTGAEVGGGGVAMRNTK